MNKKEFFGEHKQTDVRKYPVTFIHEMRFLQQYFAKFMQDGICSKMRTRTTNINDTQLSPFFFSFMHTFFSALIDETLLLPQNDLLVYCMSTLIISTFNQNHQQLWSHYSCVWLLLLNFCYSSVLFFQVIVLVLRRYRFFSMSKTEEYSSQVFLHFIITVLYHS